MRASVVQVAGRFSLNAALVVLKGMFRERISIACRQEPTASAVQAAWRVDSG